MREDLLPLLAPRRVGLPDEEPPMTYNRRSKLITQGIARSPNRAMLRAVGFNDGDFDNIPHGNDLFVSGDIDGLRWEIGGGVDVRLLIGRRIMLGIGAGVTYWNSFEVNGAARNGVGIIVISDDELDFNGLDAFTRLMIAIRF